MRPIRLACVGCLLSEKPRSRLLRFLPQKLSCLFDHHPHGFRHDLLLSFLLSRATPNAKAFRSLELKALMWVIAYCVYPRWATPPWRSGCPTSPAVSSQGISGGTPKRCRASFAASTPRNCWIVDSVGSGGGDGSGGGGSDGHAVGGYATQ